MSKKPRIGVNCTFGRPKRIWSKDLERPQGLTHAQQISLCAMLKRLRHKALDNTKANS